ncbi:MAG TPA: xanthine dehydrogenase family protein molybdopterin-binding subunit [Thermaerobacter sp.]
MVHKGAGIVMPGQWIGKHVSQREDVKLVQGKGTYLDDIRLPGLVEMAILRSPYPHARIRGIRTDLAREQEGVLAVITGGDIVARTRPFVHRGAGSDKRPLAYFALATDKVRYVGEPVAAVVAANRYRAEEALNAIAVEYDPLPPVADMQVARQPGAPKVWDHWPDNVMLEYRFRHGDPDAALAEADVVVSEPIYCQRYTGMPMETRGCVAAYDGERLTVWTNSQWPHVYRSVIAECLDMPEHRIRVITPNVGGGFGVKYHFYPEDVLVPFAAIQLARPVKWIEDRREHFFSTVHSREQEITVTLGFRRDGTLLAVRAEAKIDLGSGAILFAGTGPMLAGAASMPMGYRFDHYEYHGTAYVTNKTPFGAYRGFGVTEVCQALERALDIAARRLEIDPAELRLRNLVGREDLPYRTPAGAYLTSGSFRASLEAALEAAGYEEFRQRQRQALAEGRYLGIGVATYVEGCGASQVGVSGRWGNWEYCRVLPAPDGSVTVVSGLCSQGQSHETMLAQVVADQLGIDMDLVQVILGDTDQVPFGMGAFASRGAMLGGAAAVKACEDLKNKLCRLGAALLETAEGDVEYRDGAVRVKGAPQRCLSFAELVRAAYTDAAPRSAAGYRPLVGEAVFDRKMIPRPADPHGRESRYTHWSDGAAVATCEVDPDTGFVRLLSLVMAHDCGKVINPVAVEGQCIGGLVQSIGGAFLEELVYDDSGQLLTGSFMDYLLPTAAEVPPISLVHLESPAEEIPGGFKGVGESSTIVGPAALLNAVADALAPLGVQIRETPLSPCRIWSAVRHATGQPQPGGQPQAPEGGRG